MQKMEHEEDKVDNDGMKDEKIKKKKKDKKKLHKMTDERRIYLMEEVKKRECKMGEDNNELQQVLWFKIMTELKTHDTRKDIEATKNFNERVLDIKNFRINRMMEELDESEFIYKKNLGKHAENISRFEMIYDDRLKAQQKFYDQELTSLVNESEINVDKIYSIHNDTVEFLHSAMLMGKQRLDDLSENAQSAAISKLEDAREDGKNMTKMALLDLERKIFTYRDELNVITSKYHNETRQRRVSYERLKENDTKDQQIITQQLMRIGELSGSIHKFKDMIVELNNNAGQTIYRIVSEKNLILKKYSEIKRRFQLEQEKDKNQLTNLTKNFNSTVENLERLKKKAQVVLSLIKTCRKFETQTDQIFPLQRNQTSELGSFDFFWYRVGLVELETIKLKNDLKKLRQESNCLKACIKCRFSNEHVEKFYKNSTNK